MNRRDFLKRTAAVPIMSACGTTQTFSTTAAAPKPASRFRRVRPGDPIWPSEASWESLKKQVQGRLLRLESPLDECRKSPQSASCSALMEQLKNPYFIGDHPALTQTLGWLDAWNSRPSVYAVAAAKTEDVVAAVDFAREKNLRLVVKGGGHSYKGTSNAADSLLVWTRAMNSIVLHSNFVAQGCNERQAPQAAVTVGAGAIWMHVYNAVTTQHGRYVQGGGCTTVGVAGLIQSGGFGSFSKNYGLAAAALLEAEIVTADGKVLITNACQNPDLFWAIKGGGGGSFGVVTKLTLRTRELPEHFGGVFGTIKASPDIAFQNLIAKALKFYRDQLFNKHWGEQIVFRSGNRIRISMVFQGLNKQQAEDIWRPLRDWIAKSPQDFQFEVPLMIVDIPARHFWDAKYFKTYAPQFVISDERPGAPEENIFWTSNQGEAGQFLHAYRSAWLPESLLRADQLGKLVQGLLESSRFWEVSLHFNKGLAGAPAEALAAAKDTAINPDVLNAFALAIIAGGEARVLPEISGHEHDLVSARGKAAKINGAMNALLKAASDAGSYVSESDFFERSWQRSFWGTNYPRLLSVKKKYDPSGLFFVHQGVGSEEWSADGFERV